MVKGKERGRGWPLGGKGDGGETEGGPNYRGDKKKKRQGGGTGSRGRAAEEGENDTGNEGKRRVEYESGSKRCRDFFIIKRIKTCEREQRVFLGKSVQ